MAELLVHDIIVTEVVLGKGAFGEVRIARWRGVPVAYKKAHNFMEEEKNDVSGGSLHQEIETLSRLRHPNLVLFLGAVRDSATNKLAFITELLPCSLYDIIENNKITFGLPDVLDVASDVIAGLDYLHNHNPPIVHRDISSKNILIGGNRAKIADLGQAKIYSSSTSTMSRQSNLPGAMAYAAPETLTGRYSSPIDIFSFGILLSQMCTGEYPRIDRREQQINSAGERFEVLKELIEGTVQYQPHSRPTSHDIAISLHNIRENDRYYPLIRRVGPEKDVGILALHWMHSEISKRTNELEANLEQNKHRLQAEERRWQIEAAKVDGLDDQIKHWEGEFLQAKLRYEQAEQLNLHLQAHLNQASSKQEDLTSQLKMLSSEQERLNRKLQSSEAMAAAEGGEAQRWRQRSQTLTTQITQLEASVQALNMREEQFEQRELMLNRQLEMQVGYARDLEARLEQTLSRWRVERDEHCALQGNYQKINRKCAEMAEKSEKNRKELELIEQRLLRYEGLPLPDEIKQRLEDLEADNTILRESFMQQEATEDQRREALQQTQDRLIEAEQQILQLKESVSWKDSLLQQHEQEHAQQLQRVKDEHRQVIEKLESERDAIKYDFDSRLDEMQMLQEKATKLEEDFDRLKWRRRNSVEGRALIAATTAAAAAINNSTNSPLPSTILEGSQESTIDDIPMPVERLTEIAVKHLIERTMEHEGVLGLIQLLSSHAHDERVLWRATRAIRELIIHNEDAKQLCSVSYGTSSSSGSVKGSEHWSVNTLRVFGSNSMVAGQALRLIGTLAFGNDLYRRKAGERGVIQLLCDTATEHMMEDTVLIYACTAITNLCHASAENRSRLIEADGIALLCEIMKSHVDNNNAKLLCQCCYALLTIAGSDEAARLIVARGGDTLIIKTLLSYPLDGDVQQNGLWALHNLSLADSTIASGLRRKGAIEVCRMAIENHVDQVEVRQQAQSTLAFLEEHKEAIIKEKETKSRKAHHSNQEAEVSNLLLPAIAVYGEKQSTRMGNNGKAQKRSQSQLTLK